MFVVLQWQYINEGLVSCQGMQEAFVSAEFCQQDANQESVLWEKLGFPKPQQHTTQWRVRKGNR